MTEDLTYHDISIHSKEWRPMTERQRYGEVASINIHDRRRSSLLAELDCWADYTGTVDPGTPHCLELLGESGVGKTTLIRTWMRQATARKAVPSEKRIAPYVYVCLPASSTPQGIMAACLAALGCQDLPLRGELKIMGRLLAELRTLSVHMLCIDNLEHLVNRENRRVRFASLDVLEDLIMQAGISTVLVGMLGEAESVIQMSSQLDFIMGTPRVIQPFEWDPTRPQTVNEFRSFLRTIDHALPFDSSGLDAEGMAHNIWYATDGILGWIMALIRYAAFRAIRTSEVIISSSRLAEAYDTCITGTRMGKGKINPFSAPVSCEVQRAQRLVAYTRPMRHKPSYQGTKRREEKSDSSFL